jgi:hypothetical protein
MALLSGQSNGTSGRGRFPEIALAVASTSRFSADTTQKLQGQTRRGCRPPSGSELGTRQLEISIVSPVHEAVQFASTLASHLRLPAKPVSSFASHSREGDWAPLAIGDRSTSAGLSLVHPPRNPRLRALPPDRPLALRRAPTLIAPRKSPRGNNRCATASVASFKPLARMTMMLAARYPGRI